MKADKAMMNTPKAESYGRQREERATTMMLPECGSHELKTKWTETFFAYIDIHECGDVSLLLRGDEKINAIWELNETQYQVYYARELAKQEKTPIISIEGDNSRDSGPTIPTTVDIDESIETEEGLEQAILRAEKAENNSRSQRTIMKWKLMKLKYQNKLYEMNPCHDLAIEGIDENEAANYQESGLYMRNEELTRKLIEKEMLRFTQNKQNIRTMLQKATGIMKTLFMSKSLYDVCSSKCGTNSKYPKKFEKYFQEYDLKKIMDIINDGRPIDLRIRSWKV